MRRSMLRVSAVTRPWKPQVMVILCSSCAPQSSIQATDTSVPDIKSLPKEKPLLWFRFCTPPFPALTLRFMSSQLARKRSFLCRSSGHAGGRHSRPRQCHNIYWRRDPLLVFPDSHHPRSHIAKHCEKDVGTRCQKAGLS